MITFVLCNIFERIWYSEFILHTHSRGGTRLMQDWVNWVHKLRIRKKNFIHKKLIIMIRCIIIYYFRLSNVAYPSSTILPSRMRLQCKSARILQGKNYFNNSLFIEYYFFIKWWYFIIIFFRFYAVASQFQQCRDRMVEMPELVKNVCRIFYYKVNILAFLNFFGHHY